MTGSRPSGGATRSGPRTARRPPRRSSRADLAATRRRRRSAGRLTWRADATDRYFGMGDAWDVRRRYSAEPETVGTGRVPAHPPESLSEPSVTSATSRGGQPADPTDPAHRRGRVGDPVPVGHHGLHRASRGGPGGRGRARLGHHDAPAAADLPVSGQGQGGHATSPTLATGARCPRSTASTGGGCRASRWLPAFLRRQRPDTIVLQWWTGTVFHSYLALALLARALGARVVIEFHEVQDTGEIRLPLVGSLLAPGGCRGHPPRGRLHRPLRVRPGPAGAPLGPARQAGGGAAPRSVRPLPGEGRPDAGAPRGARRRLQHPVLRHHPALQGTRGPHRGLRAAVARPR